MTKPDWLEQFERETPEPKLELIDGRLIIGNSLAGSRYYLHELVAGWGTAAVLPFAPADQWRNALREAFRAFAPPTAPALEDWRAWAEKVSYEARLEPAGPMVTGPHYQSRERLNRGLDRACGIGRFGAGLGHDFVMRLGDSGFTPDGILIGRQATERLFSRYLNGPADLVFEVLLPGHEDQDRVLKRRCYEAGRVPDYWIIDAEKQSIEFLRMVGGKLRAQPLGSDGAYRPSSMPGLAFHPRRLWQDPLSDASGVFEVEAPLPAGWSYKAQKGIDWDDVPFVPKPGLEPRHILFDEFASWCPRAKFEGYDNRTVIGGRLASRNVLGMLLRTFGLIGAVKVLHPRVWVAGLLQAEEARAHDPERKARWWDLARQAAARLRQKHKVARIAVVGDLLLPGPLNFWSELSLVVWDLPGGRFANFELLQDLDADNVIDLINTDKASEAEQRLIAAGAVHLD